uniref:GRAS54 n=1 Tax=Arundo donax TaxID=35708 RepID=A0A0A9EJI9_ARUDO
MELSICNKAMMIFTACPLMMGRRPVILGLKGFKHSTAL